MRIVVFPGVLRPPSDAALLGGVMARHAGDLTGRIPAPPDAATRGAARAWDAGPEGRELLDRICDGAAEHLRPGGRVLLVHSSLARPEETERRLAAHGLEPGVAAEHAGTLGPVARERLDYLRSIAVADDSLSERMVVVEGRLRVPVADPVP